ncbi:MAG: hypothetical protein UT30_C0021G0004 [Candidatus Uhrbacteria bacterium GW2011_GWF2_39_13]|uniref:Uncharacterized protein n=1 Tax=Candidatus Uhrbacteria bacterium GW2011_GWF2_39_13 TaxID=1618995 RepID=A0A0G0PZY7_9BACT|nr:MAG: hypothetical protein UT30_C0021G0004 [Candidatus Uhrbacteria bacterium GW2011_GWF2_39_13]
MKGNENAAERLTELKGETKNVIDILSEIRHIHASTWMKRVRQELGKLRKQPGSVPVSVQVECLLSKLGETLDAIKAAMKISSSDKLADAHEYVSGVLNKFSDGILGH